MGDQQKGPQATASNESRFPGTTEVDRLGKGGQGLSVREVRVPQVRTCQAVSKHTQRPARTAEERGIGKELLKPSGVYTKPDSNNFAPISPLRK